MMSESTRTYLPAAGFDWSLPLYDPIVKLLGGDKARMVLLDHVSRLTAWLELKCQLDVAVAKQSLNGSWIGSDPDEK